MTFFVGQKVVRFRGEPHPMVVGPPVTERKTSIEIFERMLTPKRKRAVELESVGGKGRGR